MKLQAMFKGMLLSQGYVATLRALREIAPEALPPAAADVGAADEPRAATGAPAGSGAPGEAEPADRAVIDIAGAMPWQLAPARRSRRTAGACCA